MNSLQIKGTIYAWKNAVEKDLLNPSDGICENVLNTAAHHGAPLLAADALRVLGKRDRKLEAHHYETLVEAYLERLDLQGALTLFCIMHDAGIQIEARSTSSTYLHLQKYSDLLHRTSLILPKLRKQGRGIPTAVVNCVIAAWVAKRSLDNAFKMYKGLHALCPAGPNTATFNILLRGCDAAPRKDLGMFLAAEMLALKLEPDVSTYHWLILLCLHEHSYEDAFKYLKEMKEAGLAPKQETYEALIRKCVKSKDERVGILLKEMEAAGMMTAPIKRDMETIWPERKGAGGSREPVEPDLRSLSWWPESRPSSQA